MSTTRFALAPLDNALHLKLISRSALSTIFAAVPSELHYLRALIDARSESGQESVLRFIVRAAGYDFEIQVSIDGVGRVDMVIEGCLVVEADSRKFHEGWAAQVRDRTRDCDLAAAQYMSYRALYRDIIFNPERVLAAIAGLLAAIATTARSSSSRQHHARRGLRTRHPPMLVTPGISAAANIEPDH